MGSFGQGSGAIRRRCGRLNTTTLTPTVGNTGIEDMTTGIESDPSSSGRWQLTVLPFMTRAVATIGLLFFISSLLQIHLMGAELKMSPGVKPSFATPQSGFSAETRAELMRWNGLVALEHETLQARTQSINAVILRQASLLHLGFLTGMVLCLVGAVFVLGQLQTPVTSLSGEAQNTKAALTTSSPGIVLAVLGAGLIVATLFHHYQFNLPEKVVYLSPVQYTIPATSAPTLVPGRPSAD